MENASKALLIAGSVLIVILLIAVGVRVFNSTQGTTDSVETTMNSTEVATFNSKFTAYIGKNKSRANAISLLNLIVANNSTNQRKVYVSIVESGTTQGAALKNSDLSNILNKSLTKEKYNIESDYDTNGYINLIRIY